MLYRYSVSVLIMLTCLTLDSAGLAQQTVPFEQSAMGRLLQAVKEHDLEACKEALGGEANVNYADSQTDTEPTLLILAVRASDVEIARLLVEKGANVDLRDRTHRTPLMWASYFGNIPLMNLLLDHGAGVNAHDNFGQVAIEMARDANHPDAVSILAQHGAVFPPVETTMWNKRGQTVFRIPLIRLPGAAGKGEMTYAIGEQDGIPALIIRQAGHPIAHPVTFSRIYTNASLWTLSEMNELRYNLGRDLFETDAYRIFGLVTINHRLYLGLFWYSPNASFEPHLDYFVFEIAASKTSLDPTMLRRSAPPDDARFRDSKLPLLERTANGQLIMKDGFGTFRYLPSGQWKKIGPPVKPVD
jgi:hypothetical protein